MNGLTAGGDRHIDDGRHVEITVFEQRGADAVALIRKIDVQSLRIRLRIDGDGADAHFVAGADDSYGDLAAVCDQDLTEHYD